MGQADLTGQKNKTMIILSILKRNTDDSTHLTTNAVYLHLVPGFLSKSKASLST